LLDDDGRPLLTPNRQATITLTHVGDLRYLRHWLRTRLDYLETTAEASETVLLAVGEVAGNGLRHGHPPVRVTLWLTPTRIMCDVTDTGHGIADPLAGYTPPDRVRLAEQGVGLWITRRLCDEVAMGRSPTGFTVRLTVNRGDPRTAPRPTVRTT
jgi:anti-sigma regulatory factor (Ser/Thr protein kinase)